MAETYTQILRQGTYAQYQALTEKNPDFLYFCTDNGKLFKGTVDFTNNFVAIASTSLPSVGVPGKIYYLTDTKKFKTYIGSSYVDITFPVDTYAGHSLDTDSDEDHVPTSKNVYQYGQQIKSEIIGGEDVVKDVTQSTTTAANVVVTYGDNTTSNVQVPGVVLAIANGTSDGVLSFTKTNLNNTGTTETDVTINGVVTTPTWNATSRVLTLPVNGGTAVEVNIGKDMFINDGYYDDETQELVLILNNPDKTEVRIDVTNLIPVYTGGSTASATVSVSNKVITAAVNVSAETGNKVQIKTDGLFVASDQADIDDLKNRMTTAESDIDALETRMTSAENKIDAVEGRLDIHDTDISALQGRMTTAESDIDAVETRVATVEADLNTTSTGLKARMTAAEGRLDDHDTDISALQGRMTTAEGNISTNTTNITNLTSRMGTAEDDIADIKAELDTEDTGLLDRMSAAETAITTNAGNIQANTNNITTNTENIAALAAAFQTWGSFTD